MHSKKTRIISFLMAFLLIFTFAFINPLTVSQSQAALPAIVLSANAVKIIAGVLASAGIGITAGQSLQDADFSAAAEALTYVVYRTLNGAEKLVLMALSVVDNIVEVPVSLYNAIVNNAKKLFEDMPTLTEQGLEIKYTTLQPNTSTYPSLTFTFYDYPSNMKTSLNEYYSYKKLDMSEALPILQYDGSLVEGDKFSSEGLTTNVFYLGEDYPIYTDNSTDGRVYISSDLSTYNINMYNGSARGIAYQGGSTHKFYFVDNAGDLGSWFCAPYSLSETINNYKFNMYLLNNGYDRAMTVIDFYNLDGTFYRQYHCINDNVSYGMPSIIDSDENYSNPTIYDTTITFEENPAPVIQNSTATDNVITLPTTVEGSIGLTSTDVNVGTTDVPDNPDVPDTPNTETMENINTNVGELVTGGALGEEVNTNIGTVEGLHGELTEQVDFGAVFDTIAQYISALDISSVTWFPTAVASFLVPFLPVISLGIILFFIDRVLNGGA